MSRRRTALLVALFLIVVSVWASVRSTKQPAPIACSGGVDPPIHLTSGGELSTTGTATTASIAPSGDQTIIAFVSVAISTEEKAPTPTLTGGGVTWHLLGTWYKKDGSPRDLSAFTASGLTPGPLTIGGLPTPKTHAGWSIVQGGSDVLSITPDTEESLETSHSVTLDHDPVGVVVAGFLVGQQGTVTAVPPDLELGQGHTSLLTTMTEWGTDRTASVTWEQPGHALAVAVEMDCGSKSPLVERSPSPTTTSPVPSVEPTSSPPAPIACSGGVDPPIHLTSGGELATTGSATTASIAPSRTQTVVAFVSVAIETAGQAPTPTLTGGGVTWRLLGTWYKNDEAPRDLSVFTASGVSPGELMIGGLPTPKTHTTWSIVQGGNGVLSTTADTEGILETSHSVTLDHDPVGSVVAGFLVGQEATVTAVPPYVELGQGHTSFFTTMSEWGTDKTASVTWEQPGHSLAVAVEMGCPHDKPKSG